MVSTSVNLIVQLNFDLDLCNVDSQSQNAFLPSLPSSEIYCYYCAVEIKLSSSKQSSTG